MKRTAGLLLLFAALCSAQPFDPKLYSDMRWRMIGPFRGGRTVAVSGVPGRQNVFYMAANNGGVWKSTDYGRVWKPLFDSQPTQSIGALAVAPSAPDTVYVGSGEGLQRPDLSVGNGIYKSTDGGGHWTHLGLRDGQQIPAIIVDPKNPDRLFVAVLGHPYGPNAERGIFRSTDGGQSFQKVLYKDENTGGVDLAFDPTNSNTVYAVLWAGRHGPWENAVFAGPHSGLFKSTDGGGTWTQLTAGLPTAAEGLGRIGIAISPSDPRRMYAQVDAQNGGLFRSGDAGASWTPVNHEARIWGRGDDFADVRVDPRDPDTIYVANTSTYRSDDAGKTFRAIKGAPGGDDYHTIWINPENPDILLLGCDQGATLSVNRGQTWSSWYNQPTAQFYHVITDNRFPYWVYGAQQESGSVGTVSRGDNGQITFRDWHPVGAEEYGYIAPDPLHPDLIYGGKLTRYNQRTGDVQQVGPHVLPGKYRFLRTAPVLFSPLDPHTLFFAGNVLFKTTDGAASWQVISPDLTRKNWEVPASIAMYAGKVPAENRQRGVIYTVAPSFRDAALIWAGTDDGLIHLTRDGGKTWSDVTPPGLSAWSKVSLIEASHTDPAEAWAAINRFRLDDLHPHILRTRDFGRTWSEVTAGLPEHAVVNAIREDPKQKELLYAATEIGVFFSFDGGGHWQDLNLNLPRTSVRDVTVHEDDLVAGTHGRSFWILDGLTPLRQLAAAAPSAVWLFSPPLATRIRRNQNTDTPLPPEEPAGQNPPDGAILDYYLAHDAAGPVTLEIFDSAGTLVRGFSSTSQPEVTEEQPGRELNVPLYWVRMPRILPSGAGMHRWVWDLRYPAPGVIAHDYPISAIVHDTPREPGGPYVLPGSYTLKLTAGGTALTRTLTVRMDPRVTTTPAGLREQHALALRLTALLRENHQAIEHKSTPSLTARNAALAALLEIVIGTDAAPAPRTAAAVAELEKQAAALRNALKQASFQ